MNPGQFVAYFDRISEATDAIPRLRRFILDLAVRGKIVGQCPDDEPAFELMKRIEAEKAHLQKVGEIRKERILPPVGDDEVSFALPSGWKWVRIRQVTSDRGQAIPHEAFTYIDVTSINKELGYIAEPRTLGAADAPSRARKVARKGDVLYSCVRPYLLNVAIIDTDFDPEPIARTAFAVLNGFGLVLSKYLWIVLRSPFLVECVEGKMRGQAYPAINDADFSGLPIPLPPLAEQHRIIAKVNELMTLCDRLQAAHAERERRRDRVVVTSLNCLSQPSDDSQHFREDAGFHIGNLSRLTTRADHVAQLRHAILNLAVRGRLVPQNPNDEPTGELLKEIGMEKRKQVTAGVLKSQPPVRSLNESDRLFKIPESWRWVRIDDCFNVSGGIQKTPARSPKVNTIPYVGVANVHRGSLDLRGLKQFELFDGDLEKFRLVVGDILVVEGNGSRDEIGRCAMWAGDVDDCVHQNHIIRCRPFRVEITPYVSRYLNSLAGIQVMQTLAVTSSGLFNLSVGKVRTIPIPLPPLPEQHRIVAKVDELMALCDRLEAQIANRQTESRRLLEAVLYEALNGTDVAHSKMVSSAL